MSNANDDLRVIVKLLGDDERKLGSLTIPMETLLGFAGVQGIQKKWITIFDSLNDDVYDGDFAEDDDENPRILVEFKVSENQNALLTPASNKNSQKRRTSGSASGRSAGRRSTAKMDTFADIKAQAPRI